MKRNVILCCLVAMLSLFAFSCAIEPYDKADTTGPSDNNGVIEPDKPDDNDDNAVEVSTAKELIEAVANGGNVRLISDIFEVEEMIIGKDLNLDLNGKTIGTTYGIGFSDNVNVSIKNGSIEGDYIGLTLGPLNDGSEGGIQDSSITLTNVDISAMNNNGRAIVVNAFSKNTILTIDSSNITADTFGIFTHAYAYDGATSPTTDLEIIINKSTIETQNESGDNTAVVMSVLGKMTISDSILIADRQAVLLRAGDNSISSSTISVTGKNSVTAEYLDTTWLDGNEVPLAGIVIGDGRKGYFDCTTTVALDDVTITLDKDTNNNGKAYRALYVYQYDTAKPVSVSGNIKTNATTVVNEDRNGATYDLTVSEQ